MVAVALRTRLRVLAVLPTYMSRVIRELECPAMDATSSLICQQCKAVVQNTCRRLCQVDGPFPFECRHPDSRYAGPRTRRSKLHARQ
jgi:hypothetical protein